VESGLDESEELIAEADRGGRANVLAFRAGLEAMAGRFEAARENARQAREIYEDLGWTINVWTNCATIAGDIELLAGDHAAAEAVLAESCAKLEAWGERAHLATQAAQLGEALYRQGRYDEVLRWSQLAADCAASDDAGAQFLWRALTAKSAARQGEGREAESLSREAVARAEKTDASSQHAQVLVDRAEVLQFNGQSAAAEAAIGQAMELLQAKGNIVAFTRTRSLLQRARNS
jgi:tetratricopeptide (TPR) repeat protein